jgi:hypothetical protein
VPPDGGTALQDDPDRPVFRGNGPYDYVCVRVRNVLAAAWAWRHEQARADQVRALQDDQRRRLRPQGRDVMYGSVAARKEDARFIRGQGQYVDDVQLPGMLHGAVLRRPWRTRGSSRSTLRRAAAPAGARGDHRRGPRCRGVDADAVGDEQAVLATDKVRFQGQEVAFVVATTAIPRATRWS